MRRKVASCECFSLSEVRLGEGQPVAALSVDNRGLSHEKSRSDPHPRGCFIYYYAITTDSKSNASRTGQKAYFANRTPHLKMS